MKQSASAKEREGEGEIGRWRKGERDGESSVFVCISLIS